VAQVDERVRARLRALEGERAAVERRDTTLSRARALLFFLSCAVALAALFRVGGVGWTALLGVLAPFAVIVVVHARVAARAFELDRRLELARRSLARIEGRHRAGKNEEQRLGERYLDPEHAYARDLDLFGPGSLFEQLDTTHTAGGADRLAAWLLAPADLATVRARQAAVRELAALPAFREELAVASMRAGPGIARDASALVRWARAPAAGAWLGRAAWASVLLGALAVGLAVAHAVLGLGWTRLWILAAVAELALGIALRARIEPVIAPVSERVSPLGGLGALLAQVEAHPFADPSLATLRARVAPPGRAGAAHALGRLDTLAGLVAVRHNALVQLLANAFLGWDVGCAWLVERWRRGAGGSLAGWLDALAEIEALSALATFADEHPAFVWPEPSEGPATFEAAGLAHPLLAAEARVPNDVHLALARPALLVTGSNMSGKSTLLRSIGVAAVLALAGAPVCARRLRLSGLRAFTSIHVDDSLERGISRFYAELRRLKRALDAAAAAGPPVLFLLDEVMHGTNSRERHIGAEGVVRRLLELGAIGAFTSHDLGLVPLEERTGGRVRNVHFEDQLDGAEMRFDYVMKPGPVATSNALRLMREVGIDVEIATSPG
jgi:hypothetical protein